MARGAIVFTDQQIQFLLSGEVKGITPSVAKDFSSDDGFDAFKELRWGWAGGRSFCPKCHHERVYEFRHRGKYKCASCGSHFSVTTMTPFSSRKCDFKTYMMALSKKVHEPSTISELCDYLGVQYKTAWRLNSIFGLIRGNIRPKTSEMMWPYMPNPKADGADLIMKVNSALPRTIPEQVRADVSQELILGVLEGTISVDDIKKQSIAYLKKFWGKYDWEFGMVSLNQPTKSGRSWFDII